MANYQLLNDSVDTIPIVVFDAAGAMVSAPAGDVFSVASSSPSMNAVIGATAAGTPAVVINAMVQLSPGLAFTLSDSAGLTVDVVNVDIVADAAPRAIGVDLTGVTHAPQPVPAAPGP